MTENVFDALITLPGGPFKMGSNYRTGVRPEDTPEHVVTLPSFCIGRYPVTNGRYLPFMEASGYQDSSLWLEEGWDWVQQKHVREPYFWQATEYGRSEQPVVGLSWYEAVAYTQWLSRETQRRFRLPSEAEWERAARGANGRLWPWGNRFESGRANVRDEGIARTTAVTAYPKGATPEGIMDLAGNVWEWCRSRWGRSWQTLQYVYPYEADEREDETGRYARVMRGGSWYDSWPESIAYHRGRYLPGSRGSNIGFRVVEEL